MATGLPAFDTTVQETNEWLRAVEARLPPCDRWHAYGALRAVLHALRDRLPQPIMLGLAAQVPMLVRGFMMEGWRPSETPVDVRTPAEFEAYVAERLPPAFPRQPGETIEVVLGVLSEHIDTGEVRKVASHLPAPLRAFFPAYLPVQ